MTNLQVTLRLWPSYPGLLTQYQNRWHLTNILDICITGTRSSHTRSGISKMKFVYWFCKQGWDAVRLFSVRATIYLHDTLSHLITWMIHVVACWIFMYWHAEYSCTHMIVATYVHDQSNYHALTCKVACIHMTKHACIYMTLTIFQWISNFPVFAHYRALMISVAKSVFS